MFYVMCNKFNEKLGLFVLKIHMNDYSKCTYLVRWKNKLDISDTCMSFLKDENTGYKELIIGFKIIYINTYNLFCMDITVDNKESIIFRHESFQLWESPCNGLLLKNINRDFISLNKMGM